MRFARAILAFAALASTAHAGTIYSIDFASFAVDAGQTLSTGFDSGPFRVQVNDATIIGAASPDYAGSIGVKPADNLFGIVVEYIPRGPQLTSFELSSMSVTFAATSAGSRSYLDGFDGPSRGSDYFWVLSGSTGTISYTLDPPLQATAILLITTNLNEDQITGISIDATLPLGNSSTPEPSGLVLAGIGLAAVVATARRRPSCPRTA